MIGMIGHVRSSTVMKLYGICGGAVGATVGRYERGAPAGRGTPVGVPIALGIGIGSAVGVALDNHVIGIVRGWRLFERQAIEISAQSGQMVGFLLAPRAIWVTSTRQLLRVLYPGPTGFPNNTAILLISDKLLSRLMECCLYPAVTYF